MSPEHIRVITVLYLSALVPLLLVVVLDRQRRLPRWVLPVYAASFVVCAIGWEIWFTYGLVAGDPVNLRRGPELNQAIPIHLNWILNSLADAGSICLPGLLLVRLVIGDPAKVFRRWHWGAFGLILFWFVIQNVLVEMFLYHDQLSEGRSLSWAPFAPTAPWFNPTLFAFNDRTITLQGQLPWLAMAPLFCGALLLYFQKRRNS